MFVELGFQAIIFTKMFPYNNDKISWLRENSVSTNKNLNLIQSR